MTEPETIVCTINGKDYTLPIGTTLLGFLEQKDTHPKSVVIEHNKEVLLRSEYEGVVLSDGDTLEIVQIIGGG